MGLLTRRDDYNDFKLRASPHFTTNKGSNMKSTTMSIALIVRKSIETKNFDLIPMEKLIEYQHTLADLILGCRKVNWFVSKEEGVKALNDLVNAVEARKGINFHGDATVEPYRRKKVAKKSGARRGGLLVSVDGSTPTNMSKVKVSIFKAAKEITLNQQPSEAQKKHLVNMGVWELTTVL